jgi:hypothetical protein
MNEAQIRGRALKFTGAPGVQFPVDVEAMARMFGAEVEYAVDLPYNVSGCVCPPDGCYLNRFLIIINRNKLPGHQRFTLGHELWHILNGDCFDITLSDMLNFPAGPLRERCANIFSSELLMPEPAVRRCCDSGMRDFILLCEQFGVTRTAMEIRLFRELRFDKDDFDF